MTDELKISLPADRDDSQFWVNVIVANGRTILVVNIPEEIQNPNTFAQIASEGLRVLTHLNGGRLYGTLRRIEEHKTDG